MIDLLKKLIAIPSFSREEAAAADLLYSWLMAEGIETKRVGNNVICCKDWDSEKPVLLLNAHIDTVKPVASWLRKPFEPVIEGDRLYGLGSNDDGGSLIALLGAYKVLSSKEQAYKLVFSATAEEEVSGTGGIEQILPMIAPVKFGVIGEPTGMKMAVAERGLMVLDCKSKGRSGHAARDEGENAIYKAMKDVEWFRNYQFPLVSDYLGAVKMTVTQINAGTQHNVVPDLCSFVADIRPNGLYSNAGLLSLIKDSVSCEVQARSLRLGSSSVSEDNNFVKRGMELGLECFGSPTLSNMALCDFDCVKIGPGDSARSHTADEYICLSEIKEAEELYVNLLDNLEI